MKNKLTYCVLMLLFLVSCKDKTSINENDAGDVITDYLKGNPEYATTHFKYGEIKFNSQSEMLTLEKYKELAASGYITLDLIEQKKKFLSKDSSFVYLVKLTAKSADLVLKQANDQATVRSILYVLASDKPVNFEQVNSSTAKVTVTLKKENTVFAPFQRDKDENSEFITKTYKLKLDKDEGWKVNK